MKKQSTQILALLMVIGTNSFVPSAFAADNIITRTTDKVVEWIKPVKIDDLTQAWLTQPGVKAIIYTEKEPTKYLTIESDGGVLRFHSCGCGVTPPSCPDLLAPYYTFTPNELLTNTTSFKGTIRVGAEILFGAIFLSAGSFPGITGEAASILGGLAFIGTAMDPEGHFEAAMAEDKMARGIISTAETNLKSGQNPVAIMETSGKYADVVDNFMSFLISVKGHGNSAQRKDLANQKKTYRTDETNGETPQLSCEEQQIEDLKARQDQTNELLEQLLQQNMIDKKSANDQN
jgi:hypothetical protein